MVSQARCSTSVTSLMRPLRLEVKVRPKPPQLLQEEPTDAGRAFHCQFRNWRMTEDSRLPLQPYHDRKQEKLRRCTVSNEAKTGRRNRNQISPRTSWFSIVQKDSAFSLQKREQTQHRQPEKKTTPCSVATCSGRQTIIPGLGQLHVRSG